MNKTKTVTQEWNGFGFKFIEKSDYSQVLRHLRDNFYEDEPLAKILGMPEERMADMDQKVTDILNLDHGSYYAYPLDQPEKIAAVMMVRIKDKDKELPEFKPRSPVTDLAKKCMDQLRSQYSIHEKRGLDKYMDLSLISTDKEFRGKGLATEMYLKMIAALKSQNYPIAASTFSNPFSRKIGEKLGFKEISRLNFNECTNDDGSFLFGEDNEDYMIDTVLDLQ